MNKATTQGLSISGYFKSMIGGFVLVILMILLSSGFSYSQTGPGGVGTNGTNPLWLDAHTMGGTNGAAISSWTDYSGNGINATQANGAKQPTFVTGAVNGRSAINFNGSQNMNTLGTSTMNNALYFDWYIVSEIDNMSLLSMPINVDYGATNPLDAFAGILIQSGTAHAYARTAAGALIKATFPASSGYNVYEGIYNRTAHTVSSLTNFSLNSTNVNAYFNSSTHQAFNIGGKDSYYWIDGKIAEVFVFNFALNTAQKKIMQNYISAKYGTSISSDMYTHQATHGLGLIGIGQDDATNLQTDAQGNGVVRINTPSDLGNGEYLFAGHTDVDLDVFSTQVPASLINAARFERTWRVEKTGDLGNVTLIFDLDASTDFSASFSSEYRLLVDGDGDFSTSDQIIPGTYNAGANSITFTNVNLSNGNYFTLAGREPLEIHSIASGDWSNTGTWDCSCIPSALNDVYIEPTHSVEVDVNASCRSLNITSTGAITMSNPTTLTVSVDLSNLGSFTATDGELYFSGTLPQTFSSNGSSVTLQDMRVSSADVSGLTLSDGQYTMNGTLTMEQGLLTISAAGTSLIFNSTTSGTEGRIAAIPSGSAINGNVTVKRFISAGLADWRDICSPVIGATFADWDPDLAMSGDNFPDGCASSGDDPCYESVRYTTNGIQQSVFNATDPITNNRGYYVFMGDDLVNFSGTTLSSTGTVNGSSNIVAAYGSGWQTVGNPYVSPILFPSTTRTSQIGNYFYIYDASIGDYQWYDGSDGSSSITELSSGKIAIGQSIWIFTTSAGGTMTFHQTDKTSLNATYIRSQELAQQDQNLYLKLKEQNTTYESSVMLSLNAQGTDATDSLLDIPLLVNGFEAAPRLSIASNDASLRKNFISDDSRNKAFYLDIDIKRAGYHTIELSNFEAFNDYSGILLYDNETNQFIDLKKELSYVFFSEKLQEQRFVLVLTNEEVAMDATVQSLTINESVNETMTITQMGHSFNINLSEGLNEDSQISLVNILGQQEVYSNLTRLVEGSNIISVPAELKGIHILVITTGDQMVTKKVVL